MKRLRFKTPIGEESFTDPEWIKELRSFLPPEFDDISDDDLATHYHVWSEDHFCASWLIPDQASVDLFVDSVEIVEG